MMPQSTLDLFSGAVVHGRKKSAQLPYFEKVPQPQEKSRAKRFFSSAMGQKSAQRPYFEKVPQPHEKSRAKSVFTKVIRPVAKAFSCEKKFGGLVAL